MIIGIDGSRLSGQRTGTELYSQYVIAALIVQARAQGHIVRVYVREPTIFAVAPEEVVSIQRSRLWTHIGLASEIVQRPPDVLFIPSHILPLSCAWRRRPRTVVTVHDVGYRHFPHAHPLRQRLYLELGTAFTVRFADAVIVDSEATRRDVAHFYGSESDKTTVAPLGLVPVPEVTIGDTHAMRVRFNLPEGVPYVLHIGTRQPRKNLGRLLEAFAMGMQHEAWSVERGTIHAPRSAPHASRPILVLAGGAGWGSEDLLAVAQGLGIAEHVRLTGYVSDIEKAALIRHAAVYACPSLYEGFGLPVLEAQSVGVPVICSNTSSLPEVAGESALFFDSQNVSAIAEALTQALHNPVRREQMMLAGAKNIARFSWDACAAIILARIERTKRE